MRYLFVGASLRGILDAARTAAVEGAEVLLFDEERTIDVSGLAGDVSALASTWSTAYLDGVDRVVTSPWFPETRPPLSDAIERDIPIATEAGFGLERITTTYLAVTGTNGKTTVTEVATEMLVASGIDALACGNIGTAVSSLSDDDADVLVMELSSYQLRFMDHLAPTAGALLNISPDHLDWHGSFERYVAAKAMLVAAMSPDAVLAYNADDPIVLDVIEDARCRLVPCSGVRLPDGGNGVVDGTIVVAGHRFAPTVTDPSFLFDLVVAATIALEAGASADGVSRVISQFTTGEHRRRVVDIVDGVTWVDDSKATNPHAAVAAAQAFDSVILLAGGRNKDLDLSPLTRVRGVHTLIAFGEAAGEIAEAARRDVITTSTMAEAVAKAREIAVQGDTVLLSPGCASFDEFASYAERGEVFARLVYENEE